MPSAYLEEDLYEPVRRFFNDAGYTVRGEVAHCDVVAAKGSELIAVEMKLALNLTVIVQAAQRQRICPEVWVAIVRPARSLRSRQWQHKLHLLRRLELGLLLVALDKPGQPVEPLLLPQCLDRKAVLQSNRRRYAQLQKEFSGRHGDHNKGGSARGPRMTVYREQALLVAALLQPLGQASAAQLRRLGAPGKTWHILYDNYDHWFEKCDKGTYALTAAGCQALQAHESLVRLLCASVQASAAQGSRASLAKAGEKGEKPIKKQFRGTTPGTVPKLEEKSMKEGG